MLSIWKFVGVVLDLRPFVDDETELLEDVRDLARVVSMMGWSGPRTIGRPGAVTSIASAARRAASAAARVRAWAWPNAASTALAHLVGDGAHLRAIVGWQGADPAKDERELALLAEDTRRAAPRDRRTCGRRRSQRSPPPRMSRRSRVSDARSTSPRSLVPLVARVRSPRIRNPRRRRDDSRVRSRSGCAGQPARGSRPSRNLDDLRKRARHRGRRGRRGSCGRSPRRPA